MDVTGLATRLLAAFNADTKDGFLRVDETELASIVAEQRDVPEGVIREIAAMMNDVGGDVVLGRDDCSRIRRLLGRDADYFLEALAGAGLKPRGLSLFDPAVSKKMAHTLEKSRAAYRETQKKMPARVRYFDEEKKRAEEAREKEVEALADKISKKLGGFIEISDRRERWRLAYIYEEPKGRQVIDELLSAEQSQLARFLVQRLNISITVSQLRNLISAPGWSRNPIDSLVSVCKPPYEAISGLARLSLRDRRLLIAKASLSGEGLVRIATFAEKVTSLKWPALTPPSDPEEYLEISKLLSAEPLRSLIAEDHHHKLAAQLKKLFGKTSVEWKDFLAILEVAPDGVSPEQISGACELHEMLASQRPFDARDLALYLKSGSVKDLGASVERIKEPRFQALIKELQAQSVGFEITAQNIVALAALSDRTVESLTGHLRRKDIEVRNWADFETFVRVCEDLDFCSFLSAISDLWKKTATTDSIEGIRAMQRIPHIELVEDENFRTFYRRVIGSFAPDASPSASQLATILEFYAGRTEEECESIFSPAMTNFFNEVRRDFRLSEIDPSMLPAMLDVMPSYPRIKELLRKIRISGGDAIRGTGVLPSIAGVPVNIKDLALLANVSGNAELESFLTDRQGLLGLARKSVTLDAFELNNMRRINSLDLMRVVLIRRSLENLDTLREMERLMRTDFQDGKGETGGTVGIGSDGGLLFDAHRSLGERDDRMVRFASPMPRGIADFHFHARKADDPKLAGPSDLDWSNAKKTGRINMLASYVRVGGQTYVKVQLYFSRTDGRSSEYERRWVITLATLKPPTS